MSSPSDAFGTETELRRDLGLGTATAMVIGTVIGSGIFIALQLFEETFDDDDAEIFAVLYH